MLTVFRHFLGVLCLFACVLSPSNVNGQEAISTPSTPRNVRIGYVNIRKIMGQAPQIEQIQQKLSNEFKVDRQTIIMLRNQVAELNNAYDVALANKANQNPESLQKLQKSIDDKQLALEKMQQRMQDAYNLRRNEALAKLQTMVVNTVAKVSKEKQLDIVLNNTGVIYVNTRIDITPDVFNYLAEQTIE